MQGVERVKFKYSKLPKVFIEATPRGKALKCDNAKYFELFKIFLPINILKFIVE